MKTSVLIPTRLRPDGFKVLYDSIIRTATGEIEILVGADKDDSTEYGVSCIRYDNLGSSEKVCELAKLATGDMMLMGSTDEEFITKGWDSLLYSKFPADKLAVLTTKDSPDEHRGSRRPVVSKEWYAVAGFYPKHFWHFYGDTWVVDIAQRVSKYRLVYVGDVVIEHLKKSRSGYKRDDLYARRGKSRKDIWEKTEKERQQLADKIKELCALTPVAPQ